ncbi:hypothetical protein DFLDMN_001654 [Cupriavidus sp. H19C3]
MKTLLKIVMEHTYQKIKKNEEESRKGLFY